MKKFLPGLVATVLAASFALPVAAAPVFVPKAEQVRTDTQTVEYRDYRENRRWKRERRAERRWRDERRWRRDARRHFYDDDYYYRRDRGYRHRYREPGISLRLTF